MTTRGPLVRRLLGGVGNYAIKGVLRSIDGGDSWEMVNGGLKAGMGVTSLAVDQSTLYTSDGLRIFRLPLGADSWDPVSARLTRDPLHVQCLGVDGVTLYAGTLGSGFFRFRWMMNLKTVTKIILEHRYPPKIAPASPRQRVIASTRSTPPRLNRTEVFVPEFDRQRKMSPSQMEGILMRWIPIVLLLAGSFQKKVHSDFEKPSLAAKTRFLAHILSMSVRTLLTSGLAVVEP